MKIYLLYQEVSDQYGTSEVVGAYTTKAALRAADATITTRRTFAKEVELDQKPGVVPYSEALLESTRSK